ncbi:hypothetical protein PybrP1_003264 [[Pythium] brassicae (nom. inval.)]|nr:hypothetical protein PybrP1_003264 [[Pythium] brassicae (nom. inval.)]
MASSTTTTDSSAATAAVDTDARWCGVAADVLGAGSDTLALDDLDLDVLATQFVSSDTTELEASLSRLDRLNTEESCTLVALEGSLLGESECLDGISSGSGDSSRQAKDSNSSRRRVKQELAYLRARVTELQETLQGLQTAARASRTKQPTYAGAATEAATVAAARRSTDAWEGIAARQRALRERSELENANLRASLETQLQLARSLERLLRKRPSLWTHGDGHPTKRARAGSSHADNDAAVFERLLANIEHGYASHGAVLTTNGLLGAPCGYRCTTATPTRVTPTRRYSIDRSTTTSSSSSDGDSRADDNSNDTCVNNDCECCRGGESVCVELVDAKHMPFEVRETSDAAWRIITSGYMQLQHEVYRGFEGTDDTLAITYAVTLTRKRLSVGFTARAVMKRFVEAERVVFVWESLADTDGAHRVSANGTLPSSGIQVHECGWTVFEQHAQAAREGTDTCVGGGSGNDASTPEHCLDARGSSRILTCMRMTPLVTLPTSSTVDAEDENRQVGLLSSLSLDYFGAQLDEAQQAIETLLLDDRIQQRRA